MAKELILEAKDLRKEYKISDVIVKALNGVDLIVEKGDFISITGTSGSGKSTLLNCLGLLDTPTSGILKIDGKDTLNLNEREKAKFRANKIGFVFQSFNLFQNMSALENIMAPILLGNKDLSDAKSNARDLLSRVGLEDRAKHKPSELSGGQQQRIAVARALANNPALLLADEPTGNLDTKNSQKIIELLLELNKNGQTIIMVTHEPDIASIAKKEIKLADGIIDSIS